MENTLYPNDIILVNKLLYGPKLPVTPFEIPWINFLFYLNDNARTNMDTDWWGYQRFSGIQTIEQGNVLVFQESRTFFVVKRCVGLPGDSLKMIAGEIYTNNKKYTSPITIKEHYSIVVKNKQAFYHQIDSLQMDANIYPNSKNYNELEGVFSKKEFQKIQLLPSVDSVKKKIEKPLKKDDLFLQNNNYNWTLDDMDPFTIPKKGLKITMNDFTVNLYKKTLQEFEGVSIEKRENTFYIDGKERVEYEFKKDYIFVLGDHRKNSKDSRYIGFVPVESVVGKVQCILFSNKDDTFNWNRLLKKVV